jgi:hypothetical protein
MFKQVLIGMALVAGCAGPESFHGRLGTGGVGGVGGSSGSPGIAGTGVTPIVVPGEAGTSGGLPGTAGTGPITGAAGTDTAGTAGAAGTAAGAAGATAGAAGDAGTGGVAGTGATAGAGGTVVVVDAGVAGRAGTPDAGARDAPAETAAPSVAYASTGWKPTASITAPGGADVPPNAFDGKLATRWSTGRNQMGDESFLIDLGQTMSVSRVVLDDTTHPQDFPVAYTIEVSTNGMTFTVVSMGKGATVTDVSFARANARYVRIRQTGMTPAAGSWWSIDELKIYS